MSGQGFYGFPRILDIVRATTFKAVGKAGATNGAALAGGTASGAPTAPAGPFDVGDVIVDATGTLWICTTAGTSQSSPGSFTQVGTLVDPLTTRGDIIRRGASATQRLALGAANQVLQSDGTDVIWAAAPPGGGGALTQLAQTVLGSAAASITLSSIPGTYSALWVHLLGASDQSTAAQSCAVQFNADTGANYDFQGAYGAGNGGSAGQESTVAGTSAALVAVPGTTGPANAAGAAQMLIPAYAATTFRKFFLAHSGRESGTSAGTIITEAVTGIWRSTAAITSIKIFPTAGNLITGSVATLYGVS